MKFDIYETITNRIIEQLEKGQIPWHKPWKSYGVKIKGAKNPTQVAFNRVTKKAYSLLNQMILKHAGEYASFQQWKNLGGTVKKGEKAEMVVFWKMLEIEEESKNENEESEKKKIPVLKYFQVFHISQVSGVKPLSEKEIEEMGEIEEPQLVEDAEEVIFNYSSREQLKIQFSGDSAFYSPLYDYVNIPDKFRFQNNTAEYYSTVFHELTHSTGAKKRLDRIKPSRFGDNDYSKEELVAEIGSAGLLNLLNIETPSTFTNSVAYIQSWIKALKNDTKMIVQASGKAEKAVRYIIIGNVEQEKIEGAA